jgi:hypothetical protein
MKSFHRKSDLARKGAAPREDEGGPTRRAVLAGVGAAALVIVPDLEPAARASAGTKAKGDVSAASGLRPFYVYGTPGTAQHGASLVQAARGPAARTLPGRAESVARGLAAAPVLSPDQSTLALVTVTETGSVSSVMLSLVDTASATLAARGTLHLPGLPAGTYILPTVVFAPGTAVVALVLAISSPSDWRMVTKRDGRGGTRTIPAATYRSHHQVAYFDRAAGVFTGPFSLSDEPSLALCTAAANSGELFLWTTEEPPAARSPKTRPVPPVVSRMSVYPLGGGQARLSVPAPGPWPSHEPVITLPDGDIARLVDARDMQRWSARTGRFTSVRIGPIAEVRAKIAPVVITPRPDGTLFLAKPGIGRAVVVDPADSFRVRTQIDFPVPPMAYGAPASKAVLSPDGSVLYALGGSGGGLSAYDAGTGALQASYSHGQHYSGLYQLASGTLLAVGTANPRVSFYSPSLQPLGSIDTTLFVAAIY